MGQPPPGASQEGYAGGQQQPYAGQQQPYAGQQQAYPGQQQAYPGQQQAYPGQQQPYPGQQQAYPGQQQPYPGQQQPYPGQQFAAQAAPKRNTALLIIGALLLLVGLAAGVIFIINLHQYLTIEDRWANDPDLSGAARAFGVRLIKGAAMNRMTIFGPVAGVLGVAGAVLLALGMRKK
jgi:hypothetical protein